MKKKFGPYVIQLSNLDKPFFDDDLTKGDLIDYYEKVANIMLSHIKDRPMMMHRFPDGITGSSFYQKNAPDYFPKWIKQKKVPLKEDGYTNFVVCQNKATLVYLANQAMITPHIWLSKIDKLKYPDKLVFDLDPSVENFKQLYKIAKALKKLLENLDLTPYVMTTGSHGLHVVVPLDRSVDFKTSRKFAEKCANQIIKLYPEDATLELRKEKRGKKIFIDTLRNQFGATSVAPYGVRARKNAPVATPLKWEELDDPRLTPQTYNIKNIFTRIKKINDPWKNIYKHRSSLKKVFEKIK